jgi:D-methionine transport system permease protein
MNTPWEQLLPKLVENFGLTLYMVSITFVIAGFLGLVVGVLLHTSKPDGILENRALNLVLNLIVNIVRPIPFILLVFSLQSLTRAVIGTHIGTNAGIFVMVVGAVFSIARIVEQNLVTVDPGIIEAVRAAGAKRLRIIITVLIPEALGPLILGYTYVVIGIVDMSAMVGAIGGGGLGNFALTYGYMVFRPDVTLVATVIIIVLVQLVQFLGNALARFVLRR